MSMHIAGLNPLALSRGFIVRWAQSLKAFPSEQRIEAARRAAYRSTLAAEDARKRSEQASGRDELRARREAEELERGRIKAVESRILCEADANPVLQAHLDGHAERAASMTADLAQMAETIAHAMRDAASRAHATPGIRCPDIINRGQALAEVAQMMRTLAQHKE